MSVWWVTLYGIYCWSEGSVWQKYYACTFDLCIPWKSLIFLLYQCDYCFQATCRLVKYLITTPAGDCLAGVDLLYEPSVTFSNEFEAGKRACWEIRPLLHRATLSSGAAHAKLMRQQTKAQG